MVQLSERSFFPPNREFLYWPMRFVACATVRHCLTFLNWHSHNRFRGGADCLQSSSKMAGGSPVPPEHGASGPATYTSVFGLLRLQVKQKDGVVGSSMRSRFF